MTDPLWTPQQAAEHLNFSPRTLEHRRRTGSGPPWVALSCKCIRYRPADIHAWVEKHLQNMPSDAQPAEVV